MARERKLSPELSYIRCPDCGNVVDLRMAVLTDSGKLIGLGACGDCGDHVTVKLDLVITRDEFKQMLEAGVPMVRYGR